MHAITRSCDGEGSGSIRLYVSVQRILGLPLRRCPRQRALPRRMAATGNVRDQVPRREWGIFFRRYVRWR